MGGSENRSFGISSGVCGKGLSDFGGAFSDVSVACCWRGSRRKPGPIVDQLRRPTGARAFESRPGYESPDFALTRKSAISGDTVRGNREARISGSRLLDFGGAFSHVFVACRGDGFRRGRGPEIDQLGRPAGARVRESPRPQIAGFRDDAKICDIRRRRGEVRKSGSRDLVGNA